jgi:hypothetical protein
MCVKRREESFKLLRFDCTQEVYLILIIDEIYVVHNHNQTSHPPIGVNNYN